MERFFGARTQFGMALALPQQSATSTSFIAQLSFPLVNGGGWGAMGLTGDMEGNFLIAVWPDGAGDVMATFRQAIDEDNPAEVQGRFKIRPIAAGTQVSQTSLTYTFLCEECLNGTLGLGPEATGSDAVMGWALSERSLADPADPASFLGFHERGFGPFTARLAEARSAGFDSAAATAGQPVGNSGRAGEPLLNIFDEGSGDEGSGDGGGDDSDDDDDEFFGTGGAASAQGTSAGSAGNAINLGGGGGSGAIAGGGGRVSGGSANANDGGDDSDSDDD
jgi:hypothetical protein